MKKLKVCTGDFAIVDDDIFELVSGWHWHFDGHAVYNKFRGIVTYLHKLIFGDVPKGKLIDHIDRNPLNNLRSNLREATSSQNNINKAPYAVFKGTSKYKGVSKTSHGTFRARIKLNRKQINIGHYKTEIEAAIAYNIKAKELFGEFAYLNQIEGESHA